MRRVPVHRMVVVMIDRRPGAGRTARRHRTTTEDNAAATPAGVPAVAVGVLARAGRRVPARDHVAHVDAPPGQARKVGAVVFEGQVFGVGDVVGGPGVLLVLGVAGCAVFLFARFFS